MLPRPPRPTRPHTRFPYTTLSRSEDARGAVRAGRAVFMRNWPYARALANSGDSPVKGNVGVAAQPAGEDGRPAATLGGQQLAVSRYAEHPEEAADLVR